MIRSLFGIVSLIIQRKEESMLIAALVVNLLILVPVVLGLLSNTDAMNSAFGPDLPARRILTCVYAAIGLVSVGLLALHSFGHVWAVPMTVALFAVQITYKLATVAMVGLTNPVVVTNMGVVAIQVVALTFLVLRV